MKIAALLGVKDEADLIVRSVDHLRSIGVDTILACDSGSTDGTLELLESLSRRNDLRVIHVPPDKPDPATPENIGLLREAGADWILFLDTDEFWIPAGDRLQDCSGLEDADIVTVRRFNVPLTRSGPRLPDVLSPPHHRDLLVYARRMPDFLRSAELNSVTPWIQGAPILPKVLVRSNRIASVFPGGHDVIANDGPALRRLHATDVLIAHLPFTTFERFEIKAENIADEMRRRPEFFATHAIWHWARWASQWKAGSLREEFEFQVLDERSLSELMTAGTIRSASSMFEEMSREPVRPPA